MPVDSFTIESAFFLSLLTILASLPTDPYFQPWYDGPPSYRISYALYRPSVQGRTDPRYENRFFYGGPPHDTGYHLEQRGRGPQDCGRNFPPQQPEYETRNPQSHRRSSDPYPGDEYPDGYGNVQNIGNSYSSHVNSADQKTGAEKTPKNIRENIEPIFGLEGTGKEDEKINFQDAARNVRTGGTPKGVEPNPRIVTPKGGRRPAQGGPAKNQSKPGSTNTISTTEKTFRNQTTKGTKRPRPSGPKPQGGDIVFPDVYPKKFIPRVTKCAKKSTFCEHLGEEYPSDYISQVLKSEGAMFREFFGKDTISDPNITERINAPEENSLCPYRQEVVFPRAAQNKEDKWLFIINQDQYVQGVTVEVCLNPESRCILTEGFPLGYTPYCKQKYIERRLVAIGEDGKPHSDSFRLPSCCSCVVKHETTARMGLLLSGPPPRR